MNLKIFMTHHLPNMSKLYYSPGRPTMRILIAIYTSPPGFVNLKNLPFPLKISDCNQTFTTIKTSFYDVVMFTAPIITRLKNSSANRLVNIYKAANSFMYDVNF